MSSFIRFYNKALSRYPIFTQACGTGILFGTGDLIAQQIIERKNVHDFKRTGRMIAFGTILAGPAVANWYRVLDRYVTIKNPNNALVTRVAMDQIFFAPCFMGIFFIAQGIMEGQKLESIKKKLEKGYPSALVNNYKLWPAVQLINFRFVPLQHRLLVVNTIALGWNTYLSLINVRSSETNENLITE